MSRQIGRFGKQITAAVDDLTTVDDTAEHTKFLPMNKKLVQFNPRFKKKYLQATKSSFSYKHECRSEIPDKNYKILSAVLLICNQLKLYSVLSGREYFM